MAELKSYGVIKIIKENTQINMKNELYSGISMGELLNLKKKQLIFLG